QFEAVAVRIVKVERLAHPVIGRALESHAGLDQAAERIAEGGPVWIADRDMVEPCGSRRRRLALAALPRVQADVVVVAPRAQEGGLLSQARGQLESKHAGIERQ